MKETPLALVTIVFIFLLGKKAFAEPVHACSYGCFNVEARAMVISMKYDKGEMFSVIDYKNQTAYTYLADKYFDNQGGIYERVLRISTSSVATAALGKYLNISAQAKSIRINLPSDLPNTSNDDRYTSSIVLVNSPQSLDHIAVWLAANTSIKSQIDALVDQLVPSITDAVVASIDVRIQVTFENGSTAYFEGINRQINGFTTREYDYIQGSAKFSDGSTVPRTADNVIGNWAFSNELDAAAFARLGGLWNVQLRDALVCRPTKEFECRAEGDDTVCASFQKCK